jgi:putative salt-induced outer membrane protein YdiY
VSSRPCPPLGSWRLLTVVALGVLLSVDSGSAQSVLNTERVEPQDVSGFFTSLEAGTTLQGGNSDVVNLKGNGAVGYRAKRSWIVLVGGLTYLSSSDSVSTDDRFAQIRYGWFITSRTRTFHFVQIQNSREQALAHRLLLGSGVRHSFVWNDHNRLDLGAGLMWETERLDTLRLPRGTPGSSRDLRGDLIAFAAHRLSSTSKLTNMLYVEPRVDALADTRFLDEIHLLVSVSGTVDLDVGLEWLHDSQPPASVRPDDVELDTSLSVTVK